MLDSALFTIGYAGFSLDAFIGILKKYQIDAIVDVRALPDISHFEVYKRNNIKSALYRNNIIYKFFGKQLGARPTDRKLYTDGKVDFEKIKNWPDFINCCANLKTALDKSMNICLMCAQIDPIICHRSILITDYFRDVYPQIPVSHLLPSGIESQSELDHRIINLYRKEQYYSSLLDTPSLRHKTELQKAYFHQAGKIAYKLDK